MYIDSHCHLDCIDLGPEHQDNLDNVIKEARNASVSHMLCVCINLDNLPDIKKIVAQYDDVSYSVGVHPNEAPKDVFDTEVIIQEASDARCIAIGETGLDYFRSDGDLDWQRARFKQHIDISQQLKKPLIIHMRDAKEDTLAILKETHANHGVMHCFAEDWECAKKALDLGFYISFSGIVTFKNAKALHEVAQKVPKEKMLIETDSPYLAPTPYRGNQNRPAWVVHVAEHIAQLRCESIEAVAAQTSDNFMTLFGAR